MTNRVQWLQNMVTLFRQKYEGLSDKNRSEVRGLNDFLSPCQLELINLENSKIQILLVTHFETEEDIEIIVHDNVKTYEIFETFERILESEKWNKQISEKTARTYLFQVLEGDMTYKTVIKSHFCRLYNSIQRDTMYKPGVSFHVPIKSRMAERDFSWFIRGDLMSVTPEFFIDDLFPPVMEINADSEKAPESEATEKINIETVKGFITFFYPPIWIGKVPKFTFSESCERGPLSHYCEEVVIKEKYHGRDLIIFKDGGIFISGKKKAPAVKRLNEIMAISNFKKLPALTIQEAELGEMEIEVETGRIKSSSTEINSKRTMLFADRRGSDRLTSPFSLRNKQEKEAIENIVSLSSKLSKARKTDLFLFFLESLTHFSKEEYPQAFILSWGIIEKWINELWQQYITEKGVKGDRKARLMKSYVTPITETLNLVGKIDHSNYKTLSNLISKRNKFIHEGKRVLKKDSEDCLNFCINLLKDILRKIDPTFEFGDASVLDIETPRIQKISTLST